jgi:hypothetical protein
MQCDEIKRLGFLSMPEESIYIPSSTSVLNKTI